MTIELTATQGRTRAGGPHRRERHELPVRAVLKAWEAIPLPARWELNRSLPIPLRDALERLVDPLGLHGHSDAVRLASEFRRLDEDEVEQLSGEMPFSLFWAVARLSQNLR